MTPRTIESEFSETLKSEVRDEINFDLTLEGPLLTRQHPKVLWAKLQYENNPGQEITYSLIHNWHYACFKTVEDASSSFPEIQMQFVGRPWAINKFLSSNESAAIINFEDMGAVVLSKSELSVPSRSTLQDHTLTAWLSYALSPELWGPIGKWTRFHEILHGLFQKHDLLGAEDSIGYYPLKHKAEILLEAGFRGTNLDKMYLLVLPWTFSLSALKKLEQKVQQEF